ncbi:histidine phosphatase family protein [Paracidovorax citrulli]|uniref:Phosphoglycerate mutase n=2 Tax=Paracidovorax citrulli TaxID=80869 RepID=A1TKN7_PARC0|nr:histidine phosphatase family protein [Paracidovorax citrulli]ABM31525.1 Phosphoglycerate mutase [Paracidovorax citrulli AAC00-1]ATG95378.1 phosphoglycerate kinase [Paracidovorax citrulli]MVT29401.1 phosphoglycerate kinase [Paracidovorax citrulli]MVT38146.1 phosphoglycerate kinase [Paracidovorax citrulli]PVY65710.1 alpha-ribazole phosphatase [Paracidovorax citrulli]
MSARPVRLWLVRHAMPCVAAGICYGSLDVAPDAQATADAAIRLASALPATALPVWHSPLGRCAELARSLQALRSDLSPQPDARLVEMDFGTWEGRPWNGIGRAAIDAWMADFPGHAPGNGESLARMLARVRNALREARDTGAADVVWITHAGVARCVHWLLEQPSRAPRADEWPLDAPGYGAWECREIGGLDPA